MTAPPATPVFETLAIIGFGLMGSSVARAARKYQGAAQIIACDANPAVCEETRALGLADTVTADVAEAVQTADAVMLCVPMRRYRDVATAMAPHLKPGALVTDIGSTKQSAIADVTAVLPAGIPFVPAHPVSGSEKAGPAAGMADLFVNRWLITTPLPDTPLDALDRVETFWTRCGSFIQRMDPAHHDRALAMTSHLPHLIAYTVVDTAVDLEDDTAADVIKFAAGGFRDFTRIAASDPVIWSDILVANKDSVLDMLQRFNEDLSVLQKAIRRGDVETLRQRFTRTRDIRRQIVIAGQADYKDDGFTS